MLGCAKGKEEVEKASNEHWDDEVTTVEVRIGNGKFGGGKYGRERAGQS